MIENSYECIQVFLETLLLCVCVCVCICVNISINQIAYGLVCSLTVSQFCCVQDIELCKMPAAVLLFFSLKKGYFCCKRNVCPKAVPACTLLLFKGWNWNWQDLTLFDVWNDRLRFNDLICLMCIPHCLHTRWLEGTFETVTKLNNIPLNIFSFDPVIKLVLFISSTLVWVL